MTTQKKNTTKKTKPKKVIKPFPKKRKTLENIKSVKKPSKNAVIYKYIPCRKEGFWEKLLRFLFKNAKK